VAILDIVSEVTGTVWRIEARVGQQLTPDEAVLIIESMKMEIPVCAPEAGVVQEILVKEAEIVHEGALVARLEV